MTVTWSDRARHDLTSIIAQISADNVSAAVRLRDRVVSATDMLKDYLGMGRAGRLPATRELVLPGTPYLLVYRSEADGIQILRLLHGARDWP